MKKVIQFEVLLVLGHPQVVFWKFWSIFHEISYIEVISEIICLDINIKRRRTKVQTFMSRQRKKNWGIVRKIVTYWESQEKQED